MLQERLPRSLRKYIRKEKARVRREVLDLKTQNELINQLYEKFMTNKSSNSKEQK